MEKNYSKKVLFNFLKKNKNFHLLARAIREKKFQTLNSTNQKTFHGYTADV